MKYGSVDDAMMRLNQSVIRFEGEPVFVTNVIVPGRERMIGVGNRLSDGTCIQFDLDAEGTDYTPVPVGYVNLDSMSLYVSRFPIRKWKQGLHRDNSRLTPNDEFPVNDILRSKQLGLCIKGVFPTESEVLSTLHYNKVRSRAFCRDFSVSISSLGLKFLHYRGEAVGWYQKDRMILGEGREYLIQSYEEAVHENA